MFQRLKRYSLEAKLPWRSDAPEANPNDQALKGIKARRVSYYGLYD